MRLNLPQVALVAIVLLCLRGAAHGDDAPQREFFETRIRPLLAEHCVSCHGPRKQESDLRVDHIDFLTREGNYGRAVVPGRPADSVLLQAVEHDEELGLQMPEGRDRLPQRAIDDLRQWIAQGAYWPDEPLPAGAAEAEFDLQARQQRLPWIWQTPMPQPLPELRDDGDRAWAASDVDRFVLAKLREQGLSPSSDAEPSVWLRRAHFAITGFPPRPAELDAINRDDSPAARAAVVDRLLASPHFGERWARHWMDLMRYAESRGHESDFAIANAWRYRDYLIRALNDDVPYDQFVAEHLAGDLLQRPRTDPASGANWSVLGTGWAFLGEEVHSPVDIRQDECDRIDNKVDVLSKTFLGLTVACARCHDHKFDAISQRDYYSLCGFVLSSNFRQVRFESMEHNRRVAEQLDQLTESTRREMSRVLAAAWEPTVARLAEQLQAAGKTGSESAWREALLRAAADAEHPLHLLAAAGDADKVEALRQRWQSDAERWDEALENSQVVADYGAGAPWLVDGYTFGCGPQQPGDVLIGDERQPVRGIATAGAAVKDPFWDSLELGAATERDSSQLAAESRAGRMLRTPKVDVTSGRLFYLLSGSANVYAGVDSHLMLQGPLHGHLLRKFEGALQWHAHDVSVSEGDRVYVQFGAEAGKSLEVRMVLQGDQPPPSTDSPNRLLLELAALADAERLSVAYQQALQTTLDLLRSGDWSSHPLAREHAELADWMLREADLFSLDAAARQQLSELAGHYRQQREQLQQQLQKESDTAVAWMDGNGVDERVLARGKPSNPTEPAPRRLPTAFTFAEIDAPGSGRLQLARQIADSQNPLTARVLVNRVWHHMFGRGIVATVDNFGYLGSRPTHPQLLDHLAWQFVHEDHWSIKKLVRRLALSRTFAQSSRSGDPRAAQADPDNQWLHRMPIRRLEAEAIRDALLAISGRLDRRLLGPPVPVHLTEFVVGRGRPGESGPLDGGGRRSIYTAVRRNFLPTFMLTFDVPTPFSAVGARNVTNVPAQSLALMNDPFVYQQAGVWAERLCRAEPDLAARIERAYQEAFARPPTEAEVSQCLAGLQQLAEQHGAAAGDAPVWRDFCHALLLVNDFIYLR